VARSLSTALAAHLLPNNVLSMADLYEITSPVLGVERFTSWDVDVVFGANTYYSGRVIPTRDRVRARLGLYVDQLEMEVGHGGTALFGSTTVTWSQAALVGAIDGASVKLYRAFFDSSGTLVDAVLLFGGNVGEVQPKSAVVSLTVESPVAKLRANWPKAVIQPGCRWNLYDAGCGLTRPTTWDAETTVTLAPPAPLGFVAISGHGTETGFAGGYLKVTAPSSSPLYGQTRSIVKAYNSSGNLTIQVAPPFSITVPAGLTVQIVKGCDKAAATCETTFSNLARFGGLPLVPPDSTRNG
jgi:uncharacterized phage protein (TIGR02218 family)